MDLFINKVMQLEVIHHARGHAVGKRFTGTAVIEHSLAVIGQARPLQPGPDFAFIRAVEHRSLGDDALVQLADGLAEGFVIHAVHKIINSRSVGGTPGGEDILHFPAHHVESGSAVHHCGELAAKFFGGPAQVGFHDLPDIHTGRHAQGVEHDVHGAAVGKEGHVFFRQNAGDNALVPVAARHLVAYRELALDGDIHLDHLDHAGRQVVSFRGLFTLGVIKSLDQLELVVIGLQHGGHFLIDVFALEQVGELLDRQFEHDVPGHGRACLKQHFALLPARKRSRNLLSFHNRTQTLARTVAQGTDMIGFLALDLRQFIFFDQACALVLLAGAAVEQLHVDDRAFHSGRNLEGGIFNIARLVAENGAQQLLFRRELRFALGGDLAHEDIVRLHRRADADYAAAVEVAQHVFTHVGNIAGDFFRSELGIAGDDLEFLNVYGSIDIFLDHLFGNQHGVFVVIAAPGHKGHGEVLAQGKFAVVDTGAVGQHISLFHPLTGHAGGLLAETGVLVRLVVFQQIVAADAAAIFLVQFIIGHDNALGVGIAHHTVAFGQQAGAGVAGHVNFHPRTDERLFRTQQRHSLALHVRAHERAVGVVMLEEGNQCGGNGHHLTGRNVHQGHFIGIGLKHIAVGGAHGDVFVRQAAFAVHGGVSLRDALVLFARGVQMHDLVGNLAVPDDAVRRFNKAELVDLGIGCQGHDQADVRAFRRFNGADAAVV